MKRDSAPSKRANSPGNRPSRSTSISSRGEAPPAGPPGPRTERFPRGGNRGAPPNEAPRSEIICVGSELLSGKVNTHAAYLAPSLSSAGLEVAREATLADDAEDIRDALEAALRRAEVVLVTGGLGPTFDDVTREAAAAAVGRPLVYRPELYARILRRYRRFRLRVPASNRRQAWVIQGARALDNPHGSAPGQALVLPRVPGKGPERLLFLLPGPFDEMSPMFERLVLPALRRRFAPGRASARRVFRFYGLAEAAVDRRLAPLLAGRGAGVEYTILARLGFVDLHARARAATSAGARALLERVERKVRRLMGGRLYGRDGETLASAVGERLRRRGWTLATAESCTGGLLAQWITAVPGSSAWFRGGAVAYHNGLKESLLGVRGETLRRHGAVSEPCAVEMARGARERLGADAAVSITGIAGPGGAAPGKPVGLVHIAAAAPGRELRRSFRFPGNREQVRERAASAALHLLYLLLSSARSRL